VTSFLSITPLWVMLLYLGGIVYTREPSKAANRSFLVFVIMLVFWSVSVRALYLESFFIPPVWYGRLAFAGASLALTSFVLLAQCFPDQSGVALNTGGRYLVWFGVGLCGLSLTPWIVSSREILANGYMRLNYGPVYPVFSIFMLLSFTYAVGHLIRKWRRTRGREQLQIQYLLIGFGLTFTCSITTNIVLPMLTHSSNSSQYGPYFTLFFVGLTAHALIRHRFMDSHLIIRASVTYVLSLGVIAGIMWSILALLYVVLGTEHLVESASTTIVAGMGSVVLFHPLRVGMKRLFDKYCYRETYDYRHATAMISQELPGLMRVGPLCEYLTAFLVSTLQVELAAVYLCEQQTVLQYRVSAGRRDDWDFPTHLDVPESIGLMVRIGKPLLREEYQWWQETDGIEGMMTLFSDLRSAVLIPLFVERQHRLVAMIAIGDKLSGDPFFQQDVELLTTIEHQASVAFRRAELYEEVAWMQEYNESILRQMKSGMIAVNAEGMITIINETAVALLHTSSEQCLQSDIRDTLDRELSTPLLLALTGEVIYTEHETTVMLAGDQALPLVLGTSALHGPDGELAGAILVFHDLSRVKEMAEEKQRIERLASVGAFAGKIAHEIKNPLVAIKTLAELLPEQYDDEEFRTTFAQIALQEVERIDNLVRRLRGLKTSAVIHMNRIDILTPLEETLALLSGELQKRHIEVTRQYQTPLPQLIGSPDQLKQVFLNICLNSAEAMEQNGHLQVAVGVERDDETTDVVITFADTGPGIDPDVLDTLFEAFVTSKSDGSGLGMAICKDIVGLHRGAIRAANRSDGPGAMFTIRLPVSQGDATYESDASDHGLAPTTHAVSECAG
jgi:two-component system nitrogen regulation sensor histidine kinase GlnL